MHEELWKQLGKLDKHKTSKRAKCRYDSDSDSYVIKLLNREYTVNLAKKQVFSAQACSKSDEAGFLEQLCILTYLINAKVLSLANKLVKAESLPGGAFFFRGPHVLPYIELADAFGANPDLLYQAGTQLKAEKCDFGDASIRLPVLPRIAVTFVIWSGDDEFDARASILFDRTASEQLPLDALLAAVNLAANTAVTSVTRDT